MNVNQIIAKAKDELSALTGLEPSTIRRVRKDNDEKWHVTLEMLERKAIPETMDILGIYEMLLVDDGKNGGNVLEFERKGSRKRGDLEEPFGM